MEAGGGAGVQAASYPVFVISNITEDVVQVQDAAVAVLQPVNLQPVAGVLKEEERDSAPGGGAKGLKTSQHTAAGTT